MLLDTHHLSEFQHEIFVVLCISTNYNSSYYSSTIEEASPKKVRSKKEDYAQLQPIITAHIFQTRLALFYFYFYFYFSLMIIVTLYFFFWNSLCFFLTNEWFHERGKEKVKTLASFMRHIPQINVCYSLRFLLEFL